LRRFSLGFFFVAVFFVVFFFFFFVIVEWFEEIISLTVMRVAVDGLVVR